MGFQKSLLYRSALAVTLCVELVGFSLVAPKVRAQSIEVSLTFPPGSQRGAPARTAGAGRRNSAWFYKGNPPLTVLAPSNNVVTTVAANPTLFWYVPQTEAKSAEFVVVDKREGNKVYLTTVALNGTPGIVKLSLPTTVSLEMGKEYTWKFTLIGIPTKPGEQNYVGGLIERTQLNPQQKSRLAAAKEPLKQAEVYAGASVWQETLTILAQLRQDRPNDSKVADAWKELLKSVNLEAIANKPLVKCCTVEK
jgi:hypothetical protein